MPRYLTFSLIARIGLLLGLGLMTTVAAATTTPSEGDRLANNGNYVAAAKAFAAAQQQTPGDATIAAKLAQIDLLLGGHDKQAVDWAKKAVALAPQSAQYRLLLGNAYSSYVNDVSIFSKLGIAHKIRDTYQKAVALQPDSAVAHLSLAMFYLMAPGVAGGSDSKGAAQIQMLAKLDPAQADIVQARRAGKAKDYVQVEAWLHKAVAAAKDSSGYVALGTYFVVRKQPGKALVAYQQATKTYPDEPDAYYQIGKLAAAGKADPQVGIRAVNTYLGLAIDWRNSDPPYCWAHYRLAQIYARSGDKQKARAEYQQALQLNPAFKQAQKVLAKLAAPVAAS